MQHTTGSARLQLSRPSCADFHDPPRVAIGQYSQRSVQFRGTGAGPRDDSRLQLRSSQADTQGTNPVSHRRRSREPRVSSDYVLDMAGIRLQAVELESRSTAVWNSQVASRKNDDGTTSFITIACNLSRENLKPPAITMDESIPLWYESRRVKNH